MTDPKRDDVQVLGAIMEDVSHTSDIGFDFRTQTEKLLSIDPGKPETVVIQPAFQASEGSRTAKGPSIPRLRHRTCQRKKRAHRWTVQMSHPSSVLQST